MCFMSWKRALRHENLLEVTKMPTTMWMSANRCKSVLVCVNLCKFTLICVNLCKFTRICVNLNEPVRTCTNLGEFVLICVNLYESVWVWTIMCEDVLICMNLCEYLSVLMSTNLCESVQTCVNVYESGNPVYTHDLQMPQYPLFRIMTTSIWISSQHSWGLPSVESLVIKQSAFSRIMLILNWKWGFQYIHE